MRKPAVDKFVTLTSAQVGIGKLRVNIAAIAFYFRKGQVNVVVMSIPGVVENVIETPEQIEQLIHKAISGKQLLDS